MKNLDFQKRVKIESAEQQLRWAQDHLRGAREAVEAIGDRDLTADVQAAVEPALKSLKDVGDKLARRAEQAPVPGPIPE
jgi:hypothetical protein